MVNSLKVVLNTAALCSLPWALSAQQKNKEKPNVILIHGG
jgi:hypothetical protein